MQNYKRVACLYRVSTKAQVEEDDIPSQRQACMEFISRKPDWKFEIEYLEKGVSGYKKGVADRDVLQQIKSDAVDKKFDVLLVFMFDRLGRKEDETPFVVQWFDKQGIEIWSVNEGQQRFDGQADRLINYIRYWQSQGESEKTGIRVREKHTQMIKDGKRTGGVAPYGYKLIQTNETNHKGVLLHEMVIDENESEVVKLIFDLATNHGFGGYRIAKELNERNIPSRKGGKWGLSVVNFLLRNPIYKGYLAYSKTVYKGSKGRRNPDDWLVSETKNENWAIIDEDVWERVQEIRKARTPEKFKTENINYNIPMQTKSNLLFIGMIHCGECGSSMSTSTSYARWTTVNGEKSRKKSLAYKCNNKVQGQQCTGRYTYSQLKIEKAVLKHVFLLLSQIQSRDYSKDIEAIKKKHISGDLKEIKTLEKQVESLDKELAVLKNEVVNSLLGKSTFSPDLLSTLVSEKEQALSQTKDALLYKKTDLNKKESAISDIKNFQTRIPSWINEFNNAQIEVKKMLLTEILDDVVIYKDRIDIKFNSFVDALILDDNLEDYIAVTTSNLS